LDQIIEATRETFRSLVEEGVVLVDVWGPDCRPCIALFPHVERIAGEHPGLSVVKLEAPKARRLCIEMQVHGLPTFLLMRDGVEVSRLSRPTLSPRELETWLSGALQDSSGASLSS
jgi:thioredoxin 1